MNRCLFALSAFLFTVGVLAAQSPNQLATPALDVKQAINQIEPLLEKEFSSLKELYIDLHKNPELSLQEVRTSAKMARELRSLGFEVTEKVGQTGVVGVLKNGTGPTLLIRTDMDALPVIEKTGLPYASKVQVRDKTDRVVGVMHACGHDMHMTCWTGTARTLVALKDKWQGTLVLIAQPAEEIGMGARIMLEDGLYKKFPKPDYCLALHVNAQTEVGTIQFSDGLAMANVDTMEITIYGKGGHGAAPHTTVDPIVLAARVILDLQTIVSRETDPLDPAVVTVGSIHGGTKSNIIPNEVKLQLTIRSTKDSTRKNILDSIERITKAAAIGARAPEPKIDLIPTEFTPALINDSKLTQKTVKLFGEAFGESKIQTRLPVMGGEDFSRYGQKGEIPIFMFFLGTIDKDRFADSKKAGGKPLPSTHNDGYFPTPDLSIRTGVKALTLAALNLIGKK
ncbi:amidohydrolase [Telmatocola sphagniphila]|uniref:Amidohydrolase n=1 Tax=Telmatocola sphagniphila TaxID=1123043 RepID=A0A8E6BA52_9BACT|nr:amidohydrolase [Telmatocola sphagniphila]QVL34707.1 amidohydrolase [Telmatocola sphagniphila]